MTKPVTPNAFNSPGLFKIDMLSFKKSASGTVGGKARSANTNGKAPPMINSKNSEKYRKVK
jgi:hypothetical protein|tara:strand:+ start:1795 stop:1977 length:183 start_codon:yes stop_codon:yes gene_type:complete